MALLSAPDSPFQVLSWASMPPKRDFGSCGEPLRASQTAPAQGRCASSQDGTPRRVVQEIMAGCGRSGSSSDPLIDCGCRQSPLNIWTATVTVRWGSSKSGAPQKVAAWAEGSSTSRGFSLMKAYSSFNVHASRMRAYAVWVCVCVCAGSSSDI